MRNGAIAVLISLVIGLFAGWVLKGRGKPEVHRVPTIITQYDTVETLPKWYQDSVKYWQKRKYTTDTVNLTIRTTVVDTEYIPVNNPPAQRPNIWPMLRYNGGRSFGDTAVVTTFNLRNGHLAISQLYIPGIITSIDASDTLSTPRINFAPFPPEEKHGFWHNPKVFGLGFGSCVVTGLAASAFR